VCALSDAGQLNVTISDPASGTDVGVFARGRLRLKMVEALRRTPESCAVSGSDMSTGNLTIGKAFVHPAGCALGDAAIWHRWGVKP
jgi:hypothetical protein